MRLFLKNVLSYTTPSAVHTTPVGVAVLRSDWTSQICQMNSLVHPCLSVNALSVTTLGFSNVNITEALALV